MKTRTILVVFGSVIFLCVIFAASHPPQDAPRPANPRTRDESINNSIYACKQWTRAHSKIAVDEFTDEYELTGHKLKPNHYLVGVEYRSGGIGLLMSAKCEYAETGESLVLVSAETKPVR